MSIAILIRENFFDTIPISVCLFIALSSVAFYSPGSTDVTSTPAPVVAAAAGPARAFWAILQRTKLLELSVDQPVHEPDAREDRHQCGFRLGRSPQTPLSRPIIFRCDDGQSRSIRIRQLHVHRAR